MTISICGCVLFVSCSERQPDARHLKTTREDESVDSNDDGRISTQTVRYEGEVQSYNPTVALSNKVLEAACQEIANYKGEMSDLLRDFFVSVPIESTAYYYELAWRRVEQIRRQEYARHLTSIHIDVSVTNMPLDKFCAHIVTLANATNEARKRQAELYKKRKWRLRGKDSTALVQCYISGYVGDQSSSWPLVSLSAKNQSVIEVLKRVLEWPCRYKLSSDAICVSNAGHLCALNTTGNALASRVIVEARSVEFDDVWKRIKELEAINDAGKRSRLVATLSIRDSEPEDLIVSNADEGYVVIISQFRHGYDALLSKFDKVTVIKPLNIINAK